MKIDRQENSENRFLLILSIYLVLENMFAFFTIKWKEIK